MLHDIVSIPQLNAIAFLLRKLFQRVNPMERFQKYSIEKIQQSNTDAKWIDSEVELMKLLEEVSVTGLESTFSPFFTECGRWMDMPRKYEVLAVLSRMR